MPFDDDVRYVKNNPTKNIAVIDLKTGCPWFLMKYDKGLVKFYHNVDTISKFYNFAEKPDVRFGTFLCHSSFLK